ncbi:MAG: hypothetical protein PHE96_05990 [Methylococcales bacterium]|nr:hypothetical protein [Methylococcales bacterium]
MAKISSKSAATTEPQDSPEIEQEDTEILEDSEFSSLAVGVDEDSVKRDARRKIEIYWEKKRLKEQFDDFDESEFGF